MSGSLYVITTEECNMNCPFCYTKFVPDFKDTNEESHINENMAASIINIGNIINKTKYDRIIFHGGEPLLYPKTINNIINNVKYDPEYSIQTNLICLLINKITLDVYYHYASASVTPVSKFTDNYV